MLGLRVVLSVRRATRFRETTILVPLGDDPIRTNGYIEADGSGSAACDVATWITQVGPWLAAGGSTPGMTWNGKPANEATHPLSVAKGKTLFLWTAQPGP